MPSDRPKRRRFEDAPEEQEPTRGRSLRKTRWGPRNEKINIPGLPTALPPNLTKDQIDSYVVHLRVEELSRKLRMGNYVPREKK